MNKFLLYLFIFQAGLNLSAQNFILLDSLEFNADSIYLDNLGFIYTTNNNEVIKFTDKKDTLFQFSNKLNGKLEYIDVSNQLRPLLFYKENNLVVVCDNTLSPQNENIELADLGFFQIQLVASSRMDNGIWLYDNANFQLVKLNQNLQQVYQSGNLEILLDKEELEPIQLLEYQQKVYLLSKKHGILVFDNFGTYIKTISIENIDFLQVLDNGIFYKKEGKYYFYDALNLISEEIQLPQENILSVFWLKNSLYLFTKNKLCRYIAKS